MERRKRNMMIMRRGLTVVTIIITIITYVVTFSFSFLLFSLLISFAMSVQLLILDGDYSFVLFSLVANGDWETAVCEKNIYVYHGVCR